MKKRIFALLLALALALTGCGGSVSGNAGASVSPMVKVKYPKALRLDDYDGRYERRMAYPLTQEDYAALWDFAGRASALALAEEGETNSVFSPLGLWFVLALCAEGAQGETREELLAALGAGEDVAQTANTLYQRLYEDNRDMSLRVSNSLWIHEPFPVKKEYAQHAAEEFFASSHYGDFADPATAQAVGDWIHESTGGLLGGEPYAFASEDTVMLLISALYYRAPWEYQFDPSRNTTGVFHNADGTVTENVEYMNDVYTGAIWHTGQDWAAYSRYLPQGSMTFVLPDEGVAPQTLLDELETFFTYGGEEHVGDVTLRLPKFTARSKAELQEVVVELGAERLFDPETADFSAISDESLFISRILQEATLTVDEEGVLAAAYTVAEGDDAGEGPPPDPEKLEMILDRPFLFIVQSEGVPLFVGIVNRG